MLRAPCLLASVILLLYPHIFGAEGGDTQLIREPRCDIENEDEDKSEEKVQNLIGWAKYGGSYYKFFSSKKTWLQATEICKQNGARLAEIENYKENNWLKNRFPYKSFIGGSNLKGQGVWQWRSTGRYFEYSNWGKGQPDRSGDCLHFNWPSGGYWDDVPCNWNLPFICEISKDVPMPPSTMCPAGWGSYKKHCYRYFSNKLNWRLAQESCKQHGAVLAEIEDYEENNWLKNRFPYKSFIGGSDMQFEGSWRWKSTDKRFGYYNWARGQPDRSGDCLHFNWPSAGYWDDVPCSWDLPYICEKSI